MIRADGVDCSGSRKDQNELPLVGSYERRVADAQRSESCEQEAIALYERTNGHKRPVVRYQRTVPPFLKWPICRLRPKRKSGSPTSFRQLRKLLDCHNTPSEMVPDQSPTYTYRFKEIPYLHLRVTYTNGEIGSDDRRILVALCHHAHKTAHLQRREITEHEIFLDNLAELLGEDVCNGLRRKISLALWGLSGTFVTTLEGDPLVLHKSWSTNSYALLPSVKLTQTTDKRLLLQYSIHSHATEMLLGKDASYTTFDLLRSLALKNQPCAESLYLLLYDCAQWAKNDYIDLRLPQLAQFLGVSVKNGRWDHTRATICTACMAIEPIAGFLVDYKWFGRAESSFCRFRFADPSVARLHSLSEK